MEKVLKNHPKSPKKYICEICDYNTSYVRDFEKHNSTLKHKKKYMEVNGDNLEIEIIAKKSHNYVCEKCNYITNSKNDFVKHELTNKHKKYFQENVIEYKDKDKEFKCDNCSKCFVNSGGLWKHKKKCLSNIFSEDNIVDDSKSENVSITNEMFIEFMKQSKDIQNFLVAQSNMMLEMSQKQSSVITTNSHNTTNNNQFNLNFFLNETCKDAMNITDFVNSLKLDTSDFVTTGRLGYVEGISRIIINGLKDVDVEKRPIHCTDLKRETVYIKHDNTWEKEEPDKKKLKWAVNSVARLNLKQLDVWQEENPEYKISESSKNYEYMKYCSAALGGQYKEEDDKFAEKIMRNVLREVVVDKRG